MHSSIQQGSRAIRQVALLFSVCLLAACPLAAVYTGTPGDVWPGFVRILLSPAQLVTDYYLVGNLAAAFLNAGLCGAAFTVLLYLPGMESGMSTWAGYFLVVAHAFYGLNFVNMWPSVLGIYVYSRVMRVSFRENIPVAMFSTAFGPFFSELALRYPLSTRFQVMVAGYAVNLLGVLISFALGIALSFGITAILPGALLLHRGFSLYNGGLAFGLLGMLLYGLLYPTLGATPPAKAVYENALYDSYGRSYGLFCNGFFILVFGLCLLIGWLQNGRSFNGYRTLLKDSGYRSDFMQEYGVPCTWINLGIYGLFALGYFDLVILLTDGAGFTGPTCGVILAAVTFAASGQHPHNVWPILAGYALLSGFVLLHCTLTGAPVPWTLSTQSYINSAAFATGLCPYAGCYHRRTGMIAGAICAIICTVTGALHGGFVLYNGGLCAGFTALILTPMLDVYYRGEVKK